MAEVVLGINSAYHESAASVLVDGALAASAEEERFSRIKHAKAATVESARELPWNAIAFCLDAGGVGLRDVTHVAYAFDPQRRWDAQIRGGWNGDFGTPEGEHAFRVSVEAAIRALKERMPLSTLTCVPHHEAHALSASVCSPYDSCGVLVVDGIGEDSSAWAGVDENGVLRRLFTVADPNSLGFLWEKVSEFLGFCRYDGPGKVMALAAYGKPGTMSEVFETFVRCRAGGMFEIDDEVLECRRPGFAGLERAFGEKRSADCQWKADMAYGLQSVTEKVILHVAGALFRAINQDRETPIVDLALAGGVALNCVANGMLMKEGPWRRLWVQPAAHDAGTALGSALAVHRWRAGSSRISFKNTFSGMEITDRDAEAALRKWGLTINRPINMARRLAELLAAGKSVAHVNGRAEFGPRALGNRSLLADPGRVGIRDLLNRQIKQREGFRPFAPSLLRSFASEFCAASADVLPPGSQACHFMTVAVPVNPAIGECFPAVTHRNTADNMLTSRIHLVEGADTTRLGEILEEFGKQSGYPMLLNTSFNVCEPIVNSADDACRTFCRSGVEALALGPYVVTKNGLS